MASNRKAITPMILKPIDYGSPATFLEYVPFYTLPVSSTTTPTFYPIDPFLNLFPSDSFSQTSPPPPPTLQVYQCCSKVIRSDLLPGSFVPDASDPCPDRRYPIRIWKLVSRFGFVCTNHFSSSYKFFLAAIHTLSELQSYKEAIAHPEWRSAIAEELATLQKTNTWDVSSWQKCYWVQMDL